MTSSVLMIRSSILVARSKSCKRSFLTSANWQRTKSSPAGGHHPLQFQRRHSISSLLGSLRLDDDDHSNGVVVKSSSVPEQVPFGETAPRPPRSLLLPVTGRPLFPGVLTNIALTDPATIEALEGRLRGGENRDHDNAVTTDVYISCFLRKGNSVEAAASASYSQAPPPEVIKDPDTELYRTGSFCQIQRLAKLDPITERSEDDKQNGSTIVTLLAHRRVDWVSIDDIGPPIYATLSHWPRLDYTFTDEESDRTIRALSNEVISSMREIASINKLFRESLATAPFRFDPNDPYRLADFAAHMCGNHSSSSGSNSRDEAQSVLAARDPEQRLHHALVVLNREKQVSQLQQEISRSVEEKMSETQRKYFLMEQLKSIKKELGMEQDDKDAVLTKYRETMAKYQNVPVTVAETVDAELQKLSTLERNSPEYSTTRSYLDWLTAVPWNVYDDDDIANGRRRTLLYARSVLDQNHYGLEDVKDAILQFIAVRELNKQKLSVVGGQVDGDNKDESSDSVTPLKPPEGKVLLLTGPPGTGKTSIGKSIAAALGRKFYRFSVGGLSDVSEIKGHRRTYVGAMPGKLIQCLKSVGTSNPVVLIDEVDKLGMGYRGDPASALLEVLDSSQNSAFMDYFLDVPVDLSHVLFICTANEMERIPGPLLDRMEVIRLSGYDSPEKVAIAEQYLVPKSMLDSGLMIDENAVPDTNDDSSSQKERTKKSDFDKEDSSSVTTADSSGVGDDEIEEAKSHVPSYVTAPGIPESLSISKEAIQSLVRWYAREAGVRNLAKYIDKITRKLALQIVTAREKDEESVADEWKITDANLSDYVGKAVFTSDRLYEHGPLPAGIVMGLAYTSMGGSALYMETQGIHRATSSVTAGDGDNKNTASRTGGSIKVTGQLGDVMKESSEIAYTVARARLARLDESNAYFDETDIHMHVPEGATPKDGPSAGVTMVTSLLSLAMDKPIRNDLAMTGEISLTGKVLPVGGIKEKIMAARRAGITTVVLPASNERDFAEIPDYLKDNLTVHYAEDYNKVYEAAFSD